MREYERNVFKISTGRAYRPSKPNGFRRIHRELEAAHRDGRAITLIIVENCLVSELNQREAFHISARGTLNGRIKDAIELARVHKTLPSSDGMPD